jgi:hypothetical protein
MTNHRPKAAKETSAVNSEKLTEHVVHYRGKSSTFDRTGCNMYDKVKFTPEHATKARMRGGGFINV